MIHFLLILAILAPFVAARLAIHFIEPRLNALDRQASALHHLANAVTSAGSSLGEGLRRFGSSFPASVTLRHQHETIFPAASQGDEEPIPADISAYLEGWSEQWARDDELHYLRALKSKLGSWEAALRTVLMNDRTHPPKASNG